MDRRRDESILTLRKENEMKTYEKGKSYKEKGRDYKTFGITEIDDDVNSNGHHHNKIEIYGDKKLRNLIINLLNSESAYFET